MGLGFGMKLREREREREAAAGSNRLVFGLGIGSVCCTYTKLENFYLFIFFNKVNKDVRLIE